MSAALFTTKKGRPSLTPRSHQWVLLDGTKLGVAVSPDRFLPNPAGELVSVYPTYGDVVLRIPDPQTTRDAVPDESKWQVDLVDPNTGVATVAHLLVSIERLSPVTSRAQIPQARLATSDPDWSPRA